MEKKTTLARLKFTIDLSDEAKEWLNTFYSDSWMAKQNGSAFLLEFGGRWKEIFDGIVGNTIGQYFREFKIPEEKLPIIEKGEVYRGSWIMEAAIIMFGSIGTAFTILKGASELPEMAEGLSKLKDKLLQEIRPAVNNEARKNIGMLGGKIGDGNSFKPENNPRVALEASPESIEQQIRPPPPQNFVNVDLMIDARPLLALTPSILKTHKIHLSVSVSRDSFVLENLGTDPLRDVQIGLFRAATERNQWSYGDSYMGNYPIVSGHQSMAKSLGEFRDNTGTRFDLSDGNDVFVDCWVSDSHGIYLFKFFIEKEH